MKKRAQWIILISLLALHTVIFSDHSFSQTLSAKDLQDFRGSISAGCFKSQRSRRVNSNLSDATIRWYCGCFAVNLAPTRTTIQDILRAGELQRTSEEAMINFLLKGRDQYLVSNECASDAIRNTR